MEKQVVYGSIPSKSNSYKIIMVNGHHSLAKTPAVKKFESDFFLQCGAYRNRNISNYFELYLDVYFPSDRQDLDNSLKICLDCLQSCKVIKNDRQCVKIVAQKFVDKNNPRIEFSIVEVRGIERK
jgi:Holliday junction resolvase RusA-like endonuclease